MLWSSKRKDRTASTLSRLQLVTINGVRGSQPIQSPQCQKDSKTNADQTKHSLLCALTPPPSSRPAYFKYPRPWLQNLMRVARCCKEPQAFSLNRLGSDSGGTWERGDAARPLLPADETLRVLEESLRKAERLGGGDVAVVTNDLALHKVLSVGGLKYATFQAEFQSKCFLALIPSNS